MVDVRDVSAAARWLLHVWFMVFVALPAFFVILEVERFRRWLAER